MKTIFAPAIGLALLAAPASGLAEDFEPQLTGTWTVTEGSVILTDGTVNVFPDDYELNEFVVSDQQGPVFKATQTLKPKSNTKTGSHGDEPLTGQTTDLIGAVDGTGPFVALADIGDTTTYRCTLEDEQTMRCLVTEGGEHAVAGFLLLKRGN